MPANNRMYQKVQVVAFGGDPIALRGFVHVLTKKGPLLLKWSTMILTVIHMYMILLGPENLNFAKWGLLKHCPMVPGCLHQTPGLDKHRVFVGSRSLFVP